MLVQEGGEAIERLKSGDLKPDVIVCDVHMPEMSGEEFLRKLRKELEITNIPVVMLTSDMDVELEVQFLSNGADAFVTKNQDPRLLGAQVKRLIKKFSKKAVGKEAA